ncbi:MAG: BTAD domain-containing putative transcriptional regulator [Actinomycetota bacterium]
MLGPVSVRSGGSVHPVGPQREAALLAALTLDPHRAVPVDVLGEAVWGADLPRTYRKTMQGFVHRLRRRFDVALVETVGGGYRLGSRVAVDITRLDALVDQCDEHRGAGNHEQVVEISERGLRLFTGPVLAELEHWHHSLPERSRINELLQQLEEWQLDAQLSANRPGRDLVADAELLVSAAPLREQRWLLLLRALTAAGRPAEALRAFERAQRTLVDELGASPGADMQAHYRVLLELTASRARTLAPSEVPSPVSSFGGRNAELRELLGRMKRSRFVTVVGPGGVGKTRLAIEVARLHQAEASDPTWFVDVNQLSTREGLLSLVNQTVTGTPLEASPTAVCDFVGAHPALLVIDNAEHMADEVARAATTWLQCSPGLRLVVTSRHRLPTSAAEILALGPMTDAGAAWLFADRAQAQAAPLATDAGLIAAICSSVDNLPLGIELAAARTDLLTQAELLDDLGGGDGRNRLLSSQLSGRGPLQEAIRSSYEALPVQARSLLHRLTLIEGDFSLETAASLWSFGPHVTEDSLRHLLDRSLLGLVDADARRFRLLDLIRAWVGSRPAAAKDQRDGEQSLLQYWDTRSRQLSAWSESSRHADAIAFLNKEHAALHQAVRLATRRDPQLAVRIMDRTDDWWRATNRTLLSWHLLRDLVDDPRLADTPDLLLLATGSAFAHGSQSLDVGDEDVEQMTERLSAVVPQASDLIMARLFEAVARFDATDDTTGRCLQALLVDARRTDSPWSATILDFLARWELTSDPVRSLDTAQECLNLSQQSENEVSVAHAQEVLGAAYLVNGCAAESAGWLRRATAAFTLTDHPGCLMHCYESVAWLAAETGDRSLAASLLSAVAAMRQRERRDRLPVELTGFHRAVAIVGEPQPPGRLDVDNYAAQIAGQILTPV